MSTGSSTSRILMAVAEDNLQSAEMAKPFFVNN